MLPPWRAMMVATWANAPGWSGIEIRSRNKNKVLISLAETLSRNDRPVSQP
jgi:hypothetical protein